MAEPRPILGLQVGREISFVHDRKNRSDVLAMVDNPIYRINIGLDEIAIQLERQLGISMPFDYLVGLNQASEKELRWQQVYHLGAMNALFLGFNPYKSTDEYPPHAEAQALIETSSRAAGISSTQRGVITPWALDITGLASDTIQKRHMVSLRYDLEDTKQLDQVFVSIPPEYKLEEYWNNNSNMIRDFIPRGPIHPEVYPIVTEYMQQTVEQSIFALARLRPGFDNRHYSVTPRFMDHHFYDRVIEAGSPGLRAFGPGVEEWVDMDTIVKFDWRVEYPNSVAKT